MTTQPNGVQSTDFSRALALQNRER